MKELNIHYRFLHNCFNSSTRVDIINKNIGASFLPPKKVANRERMGAKYVLTVGSKSYTQFVLDSIYD